ncbi:probable ATP-dependent RNA helicase DDX56 [Halyomorpha halys]|uniref:probable ATP-dependent RNA helicase DDX56 n=1 Tax=Halyomorpha halys TaxID=286706 RepID=UPI0034D32811
MAEKNNDDAAKHFHEMGLDDRILKAIAKVGWIEPTAIQEKAIPLILEGKDVLVKARTGSGKTGAFAVPIIQKILSIKQESNVSGVLALILAPSKELSRQIFNNIQQLLIKCSQVIKVVDISPQVEVGTQRAVLKNPPEIVVSTPGRAVLHLKAGNFCLDPSLQILVIDEADLVFSFGHEEDIKEVMRYLPRVYQAILASATLTEEVSTLKGLLLHNCVSLKLQEPGVAPITQLFHYKYFAEEKEKALILYALFKLGLVKGRSIVFVNTVNKCYKLKLFLEQFEISTCILNSELPAVSRIHALSQFNDGKYSIIITSDETENENNTNDKKTKDNHPTKDKESGISRGIDFRDVSNVINFDFPKSVNSYIHRVGRTARGTTKGTAVSLVSVKEKELLDEVDSFLAERLSIRGQNIFRDFQFNMKEVEGLQYRVKEAWKVVTGLAIKETRLAEIRRELFNSKKLKHYFKDNPRDWETLRHDKATHVIKLASHVANVPDYLIPTSLRSDPSLIRNRKRSKPPPKAAGMVQNKYKAKMENPLVNLDIFEKNNEEMEEITSGSKNKDFKSYPKRKRKY